MSESRTATPPMDCEAVVRALWDFIDSELDAPTVATIHAHLDACENCKSHADFERRLVDELAALRRDAGDPVALRSRIEDALRRARADG